MLDIKKILFAICTFVFCLPFTAWLQNDILESAFQTSRNLEHIINIGNNKNAVGNEVFRGSTDVNISLDGGKLISTSQRAPLLVRITQTLLRLTIALSIPMLIWIGIKVIKSGLSGGDVKSALKEVSGILIGLALALSAVGIIYLIQSIATKSLVNSNTNLGITNTEKQNQECIGLPSNGERNTVSKITQNLNTTTNEYLPKTQGVHNITASTTTCIFKCKVGYSYDSIENICKITEKQNQSCIGLPSNSEWNTVSKITQNLNITTDEYLPKTQGVHNITASTTTCIFKCKPGYFYDGDMCAIRVKRNQSCVGLPSNSEWNTVSKITQNRNNITKEHLPKTQGVYNTTASLTTCVFKCKVGYIRKGDECIALQKRNQSCIGLPSNSEWNTVSKITQNLNITANEYLPKIQGVYNTTASTTTCVFKCNVGFDYVDRACQ